MQYISTRGNHPPIKGAEAIVLGMVPRGGLFVPETIPSIDMEELQGMHYTEIAYKILSPYFEGGFQEYTEAEIRSYIEKAYNTDKFASPEVTPLTYLNDQTAILELWHGPTAAFKDIALQIMPYFLTSGVAKLGRKRETVILVATSGDTGKAALEGYKDVAGTKIIVFYPRNGVSKVQEEQMLTTGGKNTSIIAVEGNFDDCQTMVKNIFGDSDFKAEMQKASYEFSSANSINWGRLAPQIVYYFYAYLKMIKDKKIFFGDKVNAVVPTGNFGDILAGYYAKEMGLPIARLICASNRNNVLTDFINTGVYDRKREFYRTSSPSMDIVISSNLERFLFEVTSHNAVKINRWYDELGSKGVFKIDDSTRQRIKNILHGDFATEEETFAAIRQVYEKHHYLLDTHTAVGVNVCEKYRIATGDQTPAFICGTASPFKFNQAVYTALAGKTDTEDEFAVLKKLEELTGNRIHRSLSGLDRLKRREEIVIPKTKGREAIRAVLKK